MAKAKPVQSDEDQAKVKLIRDRFDEAFRKWEPIYTDGDKNMKYIAGDPWESADRKAREDAGRPVVTFDELGQYLNQAVNEVRANPRAAKFSPEGDGANDETARFYADLMRKTEYQSNAQIAYTTAYENALQRGFGFVRLKAEYEHERSMVQQIRICHIPNPAAVYPDPDGMEPDGSDWKYLFYCESYTKSEFQRAFPDAEFTDFSQEQITAANKWIGENKCQVAEYWEVEMVEHELIEVLVPATKTRPQQRVAYIEGIDPKPKARGLIELQRRVTEVPQVCYYLTNGVELLEKGGKTKHEWAGRSIPFAACYGKIVWLNEGSGPERKILAMTTLAREPFMAYCFLAACELETVGTITKNPYFAYEGTLDEGQKNAIAMSLHEPVAVLESKPFLPGAPGVLLPLPVRNPMSVDLSAYAIAKEGARRAIQAAMGWTPLPTNAQKVNEKSGVALKRIEESGQKGSYHFIDHYNDLIRRVGVLFEDLVDKLIDTDREVMTIGPDKATKRYRVNYAGQPDEGQEYDVLPSTKGRHAVTVDVGPEFESEREQAATFLDTFIGSPLMGALEPPKRDKLMALAIRERVLGPMGEKMAEVISPTEDKAGMPDPQQLMAALQQAQQQIIPTLQAEIEELNRQLEAKALEIQSKERIALQQDATKRDIAAVQAKVTREGDEIKAETAITVQEMKMELEQMKMRLDVLLQSRELAQQRQVEGAKLEQATAMQERGREHESEEGERERESSASEGEKERALKAGVAELSARTAEKAAKAKGGSDGPKKGR